MEHKAVHEIIYQDELGSSARIAPGTVLTDELREALGDQFDSLVKRGAIKESKRQVNRESLEGTVGDGPSGALKSDPDAKDPAGGLAHRGGNAMSVSGGKAGDASKAGDGFNAS